MPSRDPESAATISEASPSTESSRRPMVDSLFRHAIATESGKGR
ncbi:MAG: hypothetical protein AAF235_00770 [Planctomycetota bacterium]